MKCCAKLDNKYYRKKKNWTIKHWTIKTWTIYSWTKNIRTKCLWTKLIGRSVLEPLRYLKFEFLQDTNVALVPIKYLRTKIKFPCINFDFDFDFSFDFRQIVFVKRASLLNLKVLTIPPARHFKMAVCRFNINHR